MVIKHAIIISVITVSIICGAIVGIVGGAGGMSAAAMVLHWIMDGTNGAQSSALP